MARGGGGSRWEPPDLPAARWQGTECGPLRSRWGHRSPLLSAPFTAQGESASSRVSADGLSYVPQCPWVALSQMLVSVAGTHLLVPPLVNATEDGSSGQPTVGSVRGRLRRCHWPVHRDPRLRLAEPPTPDARRPKPSPPPGPVQVAPHTAPTFHPEITRKGPQVSPLLQHHRPGISGDPPQQTRQTRSLRGTDEAPAGCPSAFTGWGASSLARGPGPPAPPALPTRASAWGPLLGASLD